MSLLALLTWLNAELINWAGGRFIGASTAASTAHDSPLAHLYSLNAIQVLYDYTYQVHLLLFCSTCCAAVPLLHSLIL
jgi:hypothetical protein